MLKDMLEVAFIPDGISLETVMPNVCKWAMMCRNVYQAAIGHPAPLAAAEGPALSPSQREKLSSSLLSSGKAVVPTATISGAHGCWWPDALTARSLRVRAGAASWETHLEPISADFHCLAAFYP